jgi:vacuolar iron transporter family protein
MDKKTVSAICAIQKEEIVGYHIYRRLGSLIKSPENARILNEIADAELGHYRVLKGYTGAEVRPSRLRVLAYVVMARVLGLTFSLKLMEGKEHNAEETYSNIGAFVPEVEAILRDEDAHESTLIDMIDEERLKYVGSIVLGLNDALVELTGALAGFTFAIQNSRTIAMLGLITGIAATLSMAASEFLSRSHEDEAPEGTSALKSSVYTGIAYIITVTILVLPYFLFGNPFVSFAVMLASVITIIFSFTFYISVAKEMPFFSGFMRMALISIGVALISFGIGWFARTYLGFQI